MKGKLKRLLAAGVDVVLFILFFDFLFYQLIGSWLFQNDLFSTFVGHLLGVLLLAIITFARGGVSIGKQLFGLNLANVKKEKVSFIQCLGRYFFSYFVYMFTFGTALFVSVIMMAFRKDGRMLHDFIAGTSVRATSK